MNKSTRPSPSLVVLFFLAALLCGATVMFGAYVAEMTQNAFSSLVDAPTWLTDVVVISLALINFTFVFAILVTPKSETRLLVYLFGAWLLGSLLISMMISWNVTAAMPSHDERLLVLMHTVVYGLGLLLLLTSFPLCAVMLRKEFQRARAWRIG